MRQLILPIREFASSSAPLRWGADENRAGDDLQPEACAQATHEIHIDATPAQVWPWLVQMVRRGGGWYRSDLLAAQFPKDYPAHCKRVMLPWL